MTTLRPYQNEALAAVEKQWSDGIKKTLLVLPTGSGKTVVFSKIAENCVRNGERVLILAHRSELLEQAADKLSKVTGLGCAIEKADESCLDSWFRVVVGSVQSMMREKRLNMFKRDYFDTIIVDEAHHCLSESHQRTLNYFDDAKVLGVTATPDRGDMRNLGQYFETLAYEYTLPRAIKDGYLSPIKAMTIPIRLDISGINMQNGDYSAQGIDSALDPYLFQIADEMANICKTRKTVVFLPLINTSIKFRDILISKGIRAAEINGMSNTRSEILHDFEHGSIDVLCNSMLLMEGWDCPSVDCVVVLRPTKVRSIYYQMIGRGTRIYPGKDHLLLLDFLWHSERHDLCHPAHLISDDKAVTDKIVIDMQSLAGEVISLEDAELKAQNDVIADREQSLATELNKMKKRKRSLVDPLQFAFSIQDKDLTGYAPAFGWEHEKPSFEQITMIEKMGIFPDDIENAGKAAKIISRLKERIDAELSTPKQIRFLENRGFQHVGTWKFDDARMLIDRIAGNGWKIPYSIKPGIYMPSKESI